MKAIKFNYRKKEQEHEQNEKQNNWQSFLTGKKAKKRPKGSLTLVNKISIFASPDSVEGKVGVTGSGQGMTEFEQRKKYKFNDAGGEMA